jgi:TP901 family phage tail tape measure protein
VANRNTKVSLTAEVSSYIAGMDKAAAKTRELGSEAEKLGAKKEAFATLGAGALAFGAVAAVAVGAAIAKFADFDAAISNVKAATQESASNMALLRDAALEAGASSVYTATEAAGAIEELGKAGLSTAQILDGGLKGSLALAAAGQLDVASAAQTTAIALKQFKLDGDQASHVADLLAAGAGKAVGDVSDLAAALSQAGLVANQTGLSIEETTGVLAAFADSGLLGSDAGTSLKSALQRLTPQSKEAADEMKRLGISAYDASGQFIGASAFAGNLQDSLSGLTDEQRNTSLAIIFGSDAVRGASVLYEEGAAGIQKYIDQTNDSGYAAQVAADRLDNLKGDVEKLGGAFDTAMIKSGSGANDTLRALVQSATFLVDQFGSLPEPVLGVGLAFGAVAAAVALTGGAALSVIPKIGAAQAALTTLGLSGKAAAIGLGAVSLALGALVIGISSGLNRLAEISANAQEFTGTLDEATGAMTKYSRQLIAKKLAEGDAANAAELAGVSQKELTNAVLEGGDALDEIVGKLNAKNNVVDFFNGSGIAAGNAENAVTSLRESVVQGAEGWELNKEGLEGSTGATDAQSDALEQLGGVVSDTQESVEELADAIRNFGQSQFDVEQAAISFQEALFGLDGALAEGAGSLDITTEAGRATNSALLDVASATNDFAAAQYATGASTEAIQGTLESGRQKIIATRIALGDSEEAARAYADRLVAVPDVVPTLVQLRRARSTSSLRTSIRVSRPSPSMRRTRTWASGSVMGTQTAALSVSLVVVRRMARVALSRTRFLCGCRAARRSSRTPTPSSTETS